MVECELDPFARGAPDARGGLVALPRDAWPKLLLVAVFPRVDWVLNPEPRVLDAPLPRAAGCCVLP